MSIAVLNQVHDETRRLAIAGSNLARGDFRLKKLIQPLEKSAAKAPVFGQVAKSIDKLIEAAPEESAQALLDLSSLVSAILYTQGQTTIEGKLQEIDSSELGKQSTQVSAKIMKPLIEALTSTGSGRLELVKESFERGAFNDLRIVNLAVGALDDVYPELADFVADHVLPQYGNAIQPLIKDNIDIKGRAGNVRRLRALHQLDPETARPIVLDAFENGSKEMKIAALGCLGDSEEDLPHLHEQAKAKSKEVRRVAFERLRVFTDPQTIDLYTGALASADVDLVVAPISNNKSPKLLRLAQDAVESQSRELLEGKATTKLGRQLGRFATLLVALQGRADKRTVALLQSLFDQRDRLLKLKGTPTSGSDVLARLADVMLNSNSPKLHESLIDARDEFSEEIFADCFSAAVATRKPPEVYQLFSSYYLIDPKVKGRAGQRRDAVRSVLLRERGYGSWAYYYHCYHRYGLDDVATGSDSAVANAKWDPKWLSAAIQQDDLEGVSALATKRDKALHSYLEQKLAELLPKSSRHYEVDNVLVVMIRTEHPKAAEHWIETVQQLAKKNQTYGMYWVTRLIAELPVAAGPKIEKILPELPDKIVDEILEQLIRLKAKKK